MCQKVKTGIRYSVYVYIYISHVVTCMGIHGMSNVFLMHHHVQRLEKQCHRSVVRWVVRGFLNWTTCSVGEQEMKNGTAPGRERELLDS